MTTTDKIDDAVDGLALAANKPDSIIRNSRLVVAALVVTALILEIAARFMHDMQDVPGIIPKSVSLVALFLLCGTATYLIFMLHRNVLLRRMISIGVGMLLFTQTFGVLRETPYWRANQGPIWELTQQADNFLVLTGVVMLLATFYFALIEMVLVKAFLQRERTKLSEDIAILKRTEEQLRESRDELRRLTAHVEEIRELERARLARELHDELGQDLTSLKIDVQRLKNELQEKSGNTELGSDIFASMTRQIDGMVGTTRRIVTELHPAILDDLGLHAALEWLVTDFQTRTQIPCSFDLKEESFPLSKDTSTALFRIAQECLTNVARHAEATQVDLRFSAANASAELEVRDNGRGLKAGTSPGGARGFGILGMRERVRLLGGMFTIESNNGGGTRVNVTVPCEYLNNQMNSLRPGPDTE
jgi:signal transduction histidine kinase